MAVELVARWGEARFPFTVVRSARRALKIAVAPDGTVLAHAPEDAAEEEIVARVSRRGGWIKRQLQRFEAWRPRTPPRQYLSGETHLYLGKQYRLVVTAEGPTTVRLDGDRIILAAREGSSFDHRRALLDHWYKVQSHRVFPTRLDLVAPPFLRLGIPQPRLIIRVMSHRWGSFTPAGSLVLNQELARASPNLIDYVIAHEFAHALHPDHGPDWQGVLTAHMPDWRARKADLERQLL
ncbi:MAG: M48 family metallopeptidase [Caulobacteraceae bacterium]